MRRDDQSILSLADLSGKRVGVTLSPFAGTFLARQIDAQHVTVSGFEEGFRQLVNREVDVLAFDSWVASPMIRGFERHVRLVGVPFATTATAIAVRKGNAEVLAEINRGLTILKANGTVHRLTDEWRPKEMLFLRETQVETVAQWIAGAERPLRESLRSFAPAPAAEQGSRNLWQRKYKCSYHHKQYHLLHLCQLNLKVF